MPQFFEFYKSIEDKNPIYIFPTKLKTSRFHTVLITDKYGEYSSYENSNGWTVIPMFYKISHFEPDNIISPEDIPQKRDFICKLFTHSKELF